MARALTPSVKETAEALLTALERQDAEERRGSLSGDQRLQALHPDSARVLYWLVLQRAPRLIVEVGASQGYSTIWLGLAAEKTGGRVITLERNPARAALARQHFEAAGLGQLITLREGDAVELLPAIGGPVDFLFIDGTKAEYKQYVATALPLLAAGAVIVADNVISHAGDLQTFFHYLEAQPAFHNVILPVGRGLSLTLYRP